MAYDSGNLYLDKLKELIDLASNNQDILNTWEIDFIENLEEQMMEFEIGNKNLTDLQKDKIDEIYREYLEE